MESIAQAQSKVLVTGTQPGPVTEALQGRVIETVLALRDGGLLLRFTDGTEAKVIWQDADGVTVTGKPGLAEIRRWK